MRNISITFHEQTEYVESVEKCEKVYMKRESKTIK